MGGDNRLKGVGDSPVTHRISDLVLGNADNFPVQPILAYSDKFGLPSGVASVNDFSGEGFLLAGRSWVLICSEMQGLLLSRKLFMAQTFQPIIAVNDDENGIWLGNFVSDVTRPGRVYRFGAKGPIQSLFRSVSKVSRRIRLSTKSMKKACKRFPDWILSYNGPGIIFTL